VRGSHGRDARRSDQAQHYADARRHPGADPRGPFANIAHGNSSIVAEPDRFAAVRLCGNRGGLRRGHRRREVPATSSAVRADCAPTRRCWSVPCARSRPTAGASRSWRASRCPTACATKTSMPCAPACPTSKAGRERAQARLAVVVAIQTASPPTPRRTGLIRDAALANGVSDAVGARVAPRAGRKVARARRGVCARPKTPSDSHSLYPGRYARGEEDPKPSPGALRAPTG